MVDTDMVDQNLSGGTEINGVDSTGQHQEPTDLSEDRNQAENGRPPAAVAAEGATAPPTSAVYAVPATSGDGSVQNYSMMTTPPMQKKYVMPRKNYKSLTKSRSVWTDVETGDAGTPEEQAAFMKELETFHRENALDYKPPKFYGEPLNCLKLWRAVIKLGGYDVVTANKYWRQVGESFNPPKTCTTVSWTFRVFYEKALLEYEKHKRETGELKLPDTPGLLSTSVEKEASGYQASATGRVRRESATRAMHGWHSERNVGYDEISEPIIKDRNLNSAPRREKPLKSIGTHKTRGYSANFEAYKEMDPQIFDIGTPADWVKINVREAKDCYEIYALVPGLLREEVRVQSDPAGRLVITGEPEQLNNPWGITPFKKVVSLPSKIDPLRTSAEVSLYGRLYVRAPFDHRSA